jgi:hypothetical protein
MSGTRGTLVLVLRYLGPVACKSTSGVLGCAQAERHWKSMNAQITGKRAKLGSEKAKKQSVISVPFARQKNESHRKHAQWAGVLCVVDQ